VCRELSRVVRDLLIVSVDPSRLTDPEIVGEGERDRVKDLAARFSREDLLRAFDLLTKAEADIRAAAQPRYHLEMALLRWIYLRKLVSIEDLIAGHVPRREAQPASPVPVNRPASGASPSSSGTTAASPPASSGSAGRSGATATAAPETGLKDALLAEIRKQKVVFYNTIVAQAQKIEVAGDRVTFTFSPNHRTLRDAFEEKRTWLESVAQQAIGRRIAIVSVQSDVGGSPPAAVTSGASQPPNGGQVETVQQVPDRKAALRDQALADAGVQAMLEMFPAEIRDVEEM